MLQGLDFTKIRTIVELGPGTGTFTQEILKQCLPGTRLILVEIEKSYLDLLHKRFGDRVTIVNKSAHLLDQILREQNIEKVDLIVSGLPFLPKAIRRPFYDSLKRQTGDGTIFRFFTYMPSIMKKVYEDLPVKRLSFVIRNFPPLWVYGIN